MKCVCGYEIIKDIEVLQLKFIHLGSVAGTIENESYYYEQYACPKCGTVKIAPNLKRM